jgi:hypothetical protein
MQATLRVLYSFELTGRGAVLVADIVAGEIRRGMKAIGTGGSSLTVSDVEIVDSSGGAEAHLGLLFDERVGVEELRRVFPTGSEARFADPDVDGGSLSRFWFPLDTGIGIGVTAASELEALEMAEEARRRYRPGSRLQPPIRDVDVRTLDQKHVIPNMGPSAVRGVWFPALNI